MVSAVEVVADADGEILADLTLDREVRLLRVGVLEVLARRETEGLVDEREAGGQEVLVDPQRVRQPGIEDLLAGTNAQTSGGAGAKAVPETGETLECIGRIQVQVVQWAGRRARIARSATEQNGLRRTNAVGRIAQEKDAQQRMVVEQAVRATDYGLAALEGVPGEADARRYVVPVGIEALLDVQRVIRGVGERVGHLEPRRDLHVITHAVVEGEVRRHSPRILDEDAVGMVDERILRVADALDERLREAEPVGLHGVEFRERRRKTE